MRRLRNARLRSRRQTPPTAFAKPSRRCAAAVPLAADRSRHRLRARSDPGPRDGAADAGGFYEGLTARRRSKPSRSARRNSTRPTTSRKGSVRPSISTAAAVAIRNQPSAAPARRSIRRRRWPTQFNMLPPFITVDGPVREARFVRNADGSPDGGVHGLFTISGREGADGLRIDPARLRRASWPAATSSSASRRRVFGAGLIESHSGQRNSEEPGKVGAGQAGARHSRPAQRAAHRQFDLGPTQPQRQRRHDRALRLEGAEQVAADLLRRGVQRRNGGHQLGIPH